MLIEVGEFCRRVESDLNGFVDKLQDLTGRHGTKETWAWKTSLPKLSVVLARPELSGFHLHLGDSGALSIEYRLPASASWCDVVLLGRSAEKPCAAILELKGWDTRDDTPGPLEGLIKHQGAYRLHPSEQVRAYVEYCKNFHSAVQEAKADVHGCVFFTNSANVHAYKMPPHDQLVKDFPVFTDSDKDVGSEFLPFLSKHLHRPDVGFATDFEAGGYKQDRNFVEQMARQILDPQNSPFVLLDNQRLGFEVCRTKVREVVTHLPHERAVVIIEGPPGSGKSVLAAKLWADLCLDPSLPPGNKVLTTTSASQGSNWEHICKEVARNPAGKGVVIRANRYAPQTVQWFAQYNRGHSKSPMTAENWPANLEVVKKEIGFRCPDRCFQVSIVDEAHALINPEKKKARAGPHGWPIWAGPQAYQIIRCSNVTVFLMDPDQSFRDNETTSKQDIIESAKMLKANVDQEISLGEAQFRCGGSKEYLDWLEGCLGLRGMPAEAINWRAQSEKVSGRMTFEILDSPQSLEDALRQLWKAGSSVRLIATYARRWVTKKQSHPHDLPAAKKDFVISYEQAGRRHVWDKIWNYVERGNDYSPFIQAPHGTRMHDDPLCEVGCPYTVRGFDYDYLGVLWLKDLVWRSSKWEFQLPHIHEDAWKQTLAAVKKERKLGQHGTASDELMRRLRLAYRILLSRAIRGVYVWFEDEETRQHIESMLPK
jgi:hypothetical protein